MDDIPLALEGVRVLDLTQVMAGPFATMVLADLGADVVKVERPGSGDQTRYALGSRGKGSDTAAFLALNRNKRSLTLDLRHIEGRDMLHDLVRTADVVVESFRPGVTARLGVDYETLRALNAQLVYASVSGFGQTGPYAQRPGYDLIAQGMAGLMSVTGQPDGDPVKCGVPVADLSAGLFCAVGILSAYISTQRTGQGQYVDTSLFEAALALSVWETAELWSTGRTPEPTGSAHRLVAPYQALRTRDGYLTVGANNDKLWRLLCATIGRQDLVGDPRFADNAQRLAHRGVLAEELEQTLRERTTDEWLERMLAAGVPAGPINDYAQAVGDPHTRARGMVQQIAHPEEGTVRMLGIPVKLRDTPGRVRRPAPLLGEHTRELLAELGKDTGTIADLHARGVV